MKKSNKKQKSKKANIPESRSLSPIPPSKKTTFFLARSYVGVLLCSILQSHWECIGMKKLAGLFWESFLCFLLSIIWWGWFSSGIIQGSAPGILQKRLINLTSEMLGLKKIRKTSSFWSPFSVSSACSVLYFQFLICKDPNRSHKQEIRHTLCDCFRILRS